MRAPLLFAVLAGCTCEGVLETPEASFERMIKQPKLDAYEASPVFGNGRAMQHPPPGTVPYGAEPFDVRFETGMDGEQPLAEIPMRVDLALLERGRNRFQITCATCHGIAGDAQTVVAQQMERIKPPSFHSDRLRSFPPGRIFRVATEGYGLMPPYRALLSTRDRWAVVAYIQALQLRERVSLDELPPELAREAEKELR